jgi:hypothetical protein
VMSFWPSWMHTAEAPPMPTVTGERMRRINEVGGSAGDGRSVTPEGEKGRSLSTQAGAAPGVHPGSYKPVELEAHEDFAVRLAARGGKDGAEKGTL